MDVQPSGREMADIAVEAGAIDMAQGVEHTTPPQIFLEILSKYYDQRRLHIYASPAGYKGYREALLIEAQRERSNLQLESLMATNGTSGGLVAALRSHCKPLDVVLLLEPFYPAHDWAIKSLHTVTRYVPYGEDFTINLDAVRDSLPGVAVFVLSNPANPTGLVLSRDELLEIHSLCKQHDVLLIVDEVYKDFVWEGEFASLLSLVDDLDNLVVLRSFSKNLALAGWRAGYAITSPERRAAMTHIHDALYVGAPTAPQFVLADMLQNHKQEMDEFLEAIVALYRENRLAIIKAFQAYNMDPHPKQGAFYMMVKHNRSSDMVAMEELLDKGIATAPGGPFYKPGRQDTGYLRIHFALSPQDRSKVVSLLTIKEAVHTTAGVKI